MIYFQLADSVDKKPDVFIQHLFTNCFITLPKMLPMDVLFFFNTQKFSNFGKFCGLVIHHGAGKDI